METIHSLPPDTHVAHVHLQVADLGRSLNFYLDALGFQEAGQENGDILLSATGDLPYHIRLAEQAGARPKPARTTGLYHVAIRLPERGALARLFQRLLNLKVPFQGAADHLVSEALYLADPDGNGLELYADRPRQQWPRVDGQIAMTSDPLDLDGLLAEARDDRESWKGIHPGTDIGHVHLQVADLRDSEAFYHDLIGLDVTQRTYPGALFLSAGGYHHHLGMNVWSSRGGPPAPPDAAGLLLFALRIPQVAAWSSALDRLASAGVEILDRRETSQGSSALARDPNQIWVELVSGPPSGS